jgi:hypothetical protein
LQTPFVLRVFEIRGGEISARSLKVQKIEEKRVFSRFFETKYSFFQKLWQFSSFFMFTTYIRTKKSQVVKYNIIQMLTENLVEVSSVCGPGEKKFFSMIFFLKLILKMRFHISNNFCSTTFYVFLFFWFKKAKKEIF